jgi:hypothetical protein
VTTSGDTPVGPDEDVAAQAQDVVRDLVHDLCRAHTEEPGAMVQAPGGPDFSLALRLPPGAFAPRPANDAGTAERGGE